MTRRLVLLLIICVVGSSIAQQKPAKVEKLKNSLQGIKQKKGQVQKKLQETKKKTKAVVADIRIVDSRLEKVEGQLEETTTRLGQSRTEQKRLGKELEMTTHQLAETQEQVRRRLKRMYMRGQTSLVSALVGTRSAGELATRKELLERVAKADREIFEEYKALTAKVQDQKQRQDGLVRSIGSLAQDQREQQSELEDVRAEKGQTLRVLRSQQAQLRQMLDEMEADERAIAAEIAAFLRGPNSAAQLPRFSGRLLTPVAARVTSEFGNRFHPVLRKVRHHNGIDFGARTGTPIKAAEDGVVVTAGYGNGFGNRIILMHGGSISTLYGHCSRLYVRAGQRVKRGQVIGAVGSTGMSTGPHLHFEVRVNGKLVNPRSYL